MNMDMHAEITMGILYGILSEPSQAQTVLYLYNM